MALQAATSDGERSDPHLIDVADPNSWPADLESAVRDLAARGQTSAELPDGSEKLVRSLLAGCAARMYHATRLLPHELVGLKEQGLRAASGELFLNRIEAAAKAGYIDQSSCELLLRAVEGRLAEVATQFRVNRVCLFATENALEQPAGLNPFLRSWGGEWIYAADMAAAAKDLLARLGSPAVVVVRVPISEEAEQQDFFPDLVQCLIGAACGLAVESSVHHHASIPAADVLDFWTPGNASYDRYPLPVA